MGKLPWRNEGRENEEVKEGGGREGIRVEIEIRN